MPFPHPILAIFDIHHLIHWFRSLFDIHQAVRIVDHGGYGVLFLLLFSCGLGMPIPEDIPLACSGILICMGHMHLAIAAPVAWLGIIGGDTVLYTLGYRFGRDVMKIPVIGHHITESRLVQVEGLFAKYGVVVVAVGRMLAGIRGAMVVVAGTSRFKFIKFLIADGLAAIVSGGLFMYLGYWGGSHMHELEHRLRTVGLSIWIGALSFFILMIVFFWWHLKKRKFLVREIADRLKKSAEADHQKFLDEQRRSHSPPNSPPQNSTEELS